MLRFVVRQSFSGNFSGPNYPSVEITVVPNHPEIGATGMAPDGLFILSAPLASDREIDVAVDGRIAELQEIRARAKKLLADSRPR